MKYKYEDIHSLIIKKSLKFPFFKKEIEKNGVIRIKKNNLDFFSFLMKTIISQQISNNVAKLIWSRLCNQLNSKTLSINNFKNLVFLDETLKNLNISRQKRNYISNLFLAISNKKICKKKLNTMDEDKFKTMMLNYNGVGIWTCNMTLIFYFKRLNIFPEQDLVIKKMVNKLNEIEEKHINFKNEFEPFLSIVSLHLWKMSERIL